MPDFQDSDVSGSERLKRVRAAIAKEESEKQTAEEREKERVRESNERYVVCKKRCDQQCTLDEVNPKRHRKSSWWGGRRKRRTRKRPRAKKRTRRRRLPKKRHQTRARRRR